MIRYASSGRRIGGGLALAAGMALAAFVAGSLPGCLHSNLPGETENPVASVDPNIHPVPRLMAMSIEYVVNRYPPSGGPGDGSSPTFAFNLPEGMRPGNVALIESMLGGRGVRVMPENASTIPIYHVVTMWVRGHRAELEMVFPVPSMGITQGVDPVYRGVSLELENNLGSWRVKRQQLWNVGTIQVPPIRFVTGWAAPAEDHPEMSQEAPVDGSASDTNW